MPSSCTYLEYLMVVLIQRLLLWPGYSATPSTSGCLWAEVSSHDYVCGPQALKHLQVKPADNRTSIRSSRQQRSIEEASNIQKKQAGLNKFISKTFTVLLDEASTVRRQEKVTETYYKSMYRKERYLFLWRAEDWMCFLCGMWRKSHICDV